jgi:hypothetical protein
VVSVPESPRCVAFTDSIDVDVAVVAFETDGVEWIPSDSPLMSRWENTCESAKLGVDEVKARMEVGLM